MVQLILQALCDQYDLLKSVKADQIPAMGYSYAKLSYALVINNEGELKDILDLREEDHKKKLRPVMRLVPEQMKRAGKHPPAYFLCDNAKYVLGYHQYTKNKESVEEVTQGRFDLFFQCHKDVLDEDHPVMKFLERWKPEQAAAHPVLKRYLDTLDFSGNFVFFLEASNVYPHRDVQLVNRYRQVQNDSQDEPVKMNCLVNGKSDAIARIHSAIKGVKGAHTAGATLVGFNDSAFCSYGKSQSYNAPVGETAMFKYTTTLNYMLDNDQYHQTLDDQTVVFWARSQDKMQEILNSGLFGQPKTSTHQESNELMQLTKDLLIKAKYGLNVACREYQIDPEQDVFILSLSPNNARLSISLWQVNTMSYLIDRLSMHYDDLHIIGNDDPIPLWKLTAETIPKQSKNKRVSPLIEKGLLAAVLVKEKQYPAALYQAILNRIKAEQFINSVRAAIIKAYRTRKDRITKKGVGLPVALDKNHQSTAYQLGRLFALLEKIQREAIVGIKNTIKESYFSSALASPAAVFPRLLKLSTFHTAKLEHRIFLEKQKAEIIVKIEAFPKRLTLDQQGDFAVGYYHQNYDLYLKKEDRAKEAK